MRPRVRRVFRLFLIVALVVLLSASVPYGISFLWADPLQRARVAMDEVRKCERAASDQLAALHSKLTEMKPTEIPAANVRILADLKPLIQNLRVCARWLLENRSESENCMLSLEASMTKAIPRIHDAAKAHHAFAEEYPESSVLHRHYLTLSENAELEASQMQNQIQQLSSQRIALDAQLAFVHEIVIYLDRLEVYIDTFGSGNSDRSKVEFYLQQMQRFMKHFEELTSLLGSLSASFAGSEKSNTTVQGKSPLSGIAPVAKKAGPTN